MRTTFHKLFFIWQLPKEEAWINEMAAHGYGLVGVGRLSFEFEDIEPGKYRYKEIFIKGAFSSEQVREFLKFLEEMGVDNVGHVSYPNHTILYLRYENTGEELELYSDLDSKIEYEKTMVGYLRGISIANLFIGIYNITLFVLALMHGVPTWISILAVLNLLIGVVSAIDIVKRKKRIKALESERVVHE